MAARNILKVLWRGGKWRITRDGTVLSSHPSQEKAEEKARKLAGKTISSQVRIYRLNGSIQKTFFCGDYRRKNIVVPG